MLKKALIVAAAVAVCASAQPAQAQNSWWDSITNQLERNVQNDVNRTTRQAVDDAYYGVRDGVKEGAQNATQPAQTWQEPATTTKPVTTYSAPPAVQQPAVPAQTTLTGFVNSFARCEPYAASFPLPWAPSEVGTAVVRKASYGRCPVEYYLENNVVAKCFFEDTARRTLTGNDVYKQAESYQKTGAQPSGDVMFAPRTNDTRSVFSSCTFSQNSQVLAAQ